MEEVLSDIPGIPGIFPRKQNTVQYWLFGYKSDKNGKPLANNKTIYGGLLSAKALFCLMKKTSKDPS